MFAFAPPRARRRPSLTPMIDVVFLLLVFFMLASRFGTETQIPLGMAGQGSSYSGPPRLVEVRPEAISLNGVELPAGDLADRLMRLSDGPDDAVILRPRDGAALQRLVDVMETLRDAGFTRLALVDGT